MHVPQSSRWVPWFHLNIPAPPSTLTSRSPALSQFLALEGLLDGKLKFRPMTLPDRYIEHGTQVWAAAVRVPGGGRGAEKQGGAEQGRRSK